MKCGKRLFLCIMLMCVLFMSGPIHAQSLSHAWSQRFGDASDQYGYSVAMDGAGNVLVTGYFSGTVNFGGGALTSAGSYDIFIAKFDAGGTHLWSQRFGDAYFQYAYSIAVDSANNVLVTGFFAGTVNFGGGVLTSAGNNDIFIAKFDAAGTHLWSQRFGDANDQQGYRIAVDGAGNVLVTGYFGGTVNFGGGALTSVGSYDIFIAKFAAAGTHLWSQRFGDASDQYGYGLAVDGAGNVLVTGAFSSTVNFGGSALTSAGGYDIFLAKFDAAGTHLWSQRFGDASDQYDYSVAVDGAGNVWVTGFLSGTVNFGGGALTSAGGYDIFLAKFDAAGTHIWSKRFGDANDQYGYSVAVDGVGNVVVTGFFEGTVNFGRSVLTSAGFWDVFIAKFDAAGTHLWSQRFGDASNQIGHSVAVDGADNMLVTGYFQGTVDFGGGALTSAGSNDIFIAKFLRREPIVRAISDVPNDQGKQVRISWFASGLDYAGSPVPITNYSIYRRIDYALASPPAHCELRNGYSDPALAYPPGDWDYVGSVPACAEDSYFAVAPTLADSTITDGMYYSTFFVRAHTATPAVYYDSDPDSGYSVDNLAPGAPGGFAVAYNTGSGNQLSWEESPDEDFQYFIVYRGSSPDFTPDESSRVHMTTSLEWTDPKYDGWDVYYKITAVDFSGNESDPASAGDLTGADGTPAPASTMLYQNVPNPFNPSTIISFDLKEEGKITLAVYDLSGGLIRVLRSETMKAQRHDIEWDGTDTEGRPVASGVYFCRLKAGNEVLTRKAVLLK